MKFRWLDWDKDKWFSRHGTIIPFDKIEHMIGSAILAYLFTLFLPVNWACLTAFACGLLWEIKDGFLHWEVYGWWGGEGFSWKDLAADCLGVGIIFLWHLLPYLLILIFYGG